MKSPSRLFHAHHMHEGARLVQQLQQHVLKIDPATDAIVDSIRLRPVTRPSR